MDEAPVLERFGDLAVDLMPLVRSLYESFYASDARLTALSWAEMARQAEVELREIHPEVSEAAVQALSWVYAYDNK